MPSTDANTNAAVPQLTELEDRFIQVWGEISVLWGVNRTIGRIHAFLYLSEEPQPMDVITECLAISHGNCSTSIRELLAWGVIRRVHISGERKAFYESEHDPWTWFHQCIKERRRREVVPVVEQLHEVEDEALSSLKGATGEERVRLQHTAERIAEFTKFTDEFLEFFDAFLAVGHGKMQKVLLQAAKLMPRKREK